MIWSGEIGPKSQLFLLYQSTPINRKARRPKIVNANNEVLINYIILSFYQNHKMVWDEFAVFTIALKAN